MQKRIRLVVLCSIESKLFFEIGFISESVQNTQCIKTSVVELPTLETATDDIVLISIAVCIVSVLDLYSCKISQPYAAATVQMHSAAVGVLRRLFSNRNNHQILILNKNDGSFSTTFAFGIRKANTSEYEKRTQFWTHRGVVTC